MLYHQAALIGRERASKSQRKLFEYSGFAFLTMTVKRQGNQFEPVGEEDLVCMDSVEDKMIVAICDADGYSKAQTKPLPADGAKKIYGRMLKDGFKEFSGQISAVK